MDFSIHKNPSAESQGTNWLLKLSEPRKTIRHSTSVSPQSVATRMSTISIEGATLRPTSDK